MKCREFTKLIGDDVDGELIGPLKVSFDSHLTECAVCRKSYEAVSKAWHTLGELPEVEPPPAFVSRFWTRVAAEGARKEKFTFNLADVLGSRAWMPVAVTLSVLVIVGSVNVLKMNSLQGDVSRLSGSDMELIADIELAEHFDVIREMDFLQDADVIENLDTLEMERG
jgi:predicted anti-sigma-YlaC factor YlaD